VKTRVQNIAKDHRLRVFFPTNAETDTYLADSAFDVVERPIALDPASYTYREPEIEMKPQVMWTAVSDQKRGLAVISTGLLESSVRDTAQRPIALTLFRGTERTVFTNGEPKGQLLGELEFDYWLKPLFGEPDRVELLRLGQQLAAPIETVAIYADDTAEDPQDIALAPEYSLAEIVGDAIITSCRMLGEEIEIRLFNPNDSESKASLTFNRPITEASLTNFEGQSPENIPVQDNTIPLKFTPKQILTLRIQI
ncbi:MAG: glycosyl hydrolase-related protein, partial [Phototrophicaceae bacterium]